MSSTIALNYRSKVSIVYLIGPVVSDIVSSVTSGCVKILLFFLDERMLDYQTRVPGMIQVSALEMSSES